MNQDETEAGRLKHFAGELIAMASRLEARERAETIRPATPSLCSEPILRVQAPVELAEWIYRQRRLRSSVFGDDSLFGEPAWDLLLDLCIAEWSGKDLSVNSACIGSAVPTTTALRWVGILEEKGLAVRESDTRDARRSFIRLTTKGRAHMTEYFNRAQPLGAAAESRNSGRPAPGS